MFQLGLIPASGVRASPHASVRGATGRSLFCGLLHADRCPSISCRENRHVLCHGLYFRPRHLASPDEQPGFATEIGSPLGHGMVFCCLDGCDLNFHSTLSVDVVFLICFQIMHVNMCGLLVLNGNRQDVSPEMETMQMYW